MKLHLTTAAGQNMVTGYGADHVLVNGVRYERSLIILPETILRDWPVARHDQLEAQHFQAALDARPEIFLLGTGLQHRFPSPRLYADLIGLGIGVEVMTTAAACRTYNILVSEGRRAAAALIIEA
jgi:uncharacterized protein